MSFSPRMTTQYHARPATANPAIARERRRITVQGDATLLRMLLRNLVEKPIVTARKAATL